MFRARLIFPGQLMVMVTDTPVDDLARDALVVFALVRWADVCKSPTAAARPNRSNSTRGSGKLVAGGSTMVELALKLKQLAE